MTELFLNAGIDPLINSKVIPISYLRGSNIKEFKIPDGITVILDGAFRDCLELEKVSLPLSIGVISSTSFLYCPNLKMILYEGTKEQLASISGIKYIIRTCHYLNCTIRCSDGDVDVSNLF